MRGNVEVKIYIDVAAAMAASIKFFVADNGVILSQGDALGSIPARFFTRVVRVADGALLLPSPSHSGPPGDGTGGGGGGGRGGGDGGGGGGSSVTAAAADELRDLVARFAADPKLTTLPLPPSLSRAERQVVHIAAEMLGLLHESKDVAGSARTLVLRKL